MLLYLKQVTLILPYQKFNLFLSLLKNKTIIAYLLTKLKLEACDKNYHFPN